MENEILNLYLGMLLDTNLVYAILVTWAITHTAKQTGIIKKCRRRDERILRTRILSIVVGIAAVFLFKRNAADFDVVINLAILVGFTNPFLYKLIMLLVAKFLPGVDAYLSNDKKPGRDAG